MIASSLSTRGRVAVLALVTVLSTGATGAYLIYRSERLPHALPSTAATTADRTLSLAEVRGGPHLAFRSTALGPTYGRLAFVPLSAPGGPRATADVGCDRVHASARTSVCVTADRGVLTTYRLTVLDAALRKTRDYALAGLPSRTRVASDGSLAAVTTFVSGHSYAAGAFSTETTLYELRSGRSLGNLETWRIVVDGRRSTAVDLNVWGVTFVPAPRPERFYATVATGGRTWLAQGDVRRRTLTTLRLDVECPSMSPDGRRVAFKERRLFGTTIGWRIAVLDLDSGRVVRLAESRSVDDQPEWLDDRTVLYGLERGGSAETDVWAVAADGTGTPRLLVPRAWSPAVVR